MGGLTGMLPPRRGLAVASDRREWGGKIQDSDSHRTPGHNVELMERRVAKAGIVQEKRGKVRITCTAVF